MDYFSNDEEKYINKGNKKKSFFPFVVFLCVLALGAVFYAVKDDMFSESYFGPGMTTEAKIESDTSDVAETTKKKSNKRDDGIIETISKEENLAASEENVGAGEENVEAVEENVEAVNDRQVGAKLTSSSVINKFIETQNQNKDTLAFAGDIYFSKRNINAYDASGINGVLDQKYIDIIDNHDFFVGNLECCLTDAEQAIDKEFTFKISPKYVSILKEMHLDLVTVANNHAMDFGETGFLETLESLKTENIAYVGGGKDQAEATKPYVLELNGRRYAIISATCVVPNTNWFATSDKAGLNSGYYGNAVCNQIKKIKDKVDKVIVYIHWGVEKDTVSNEEQQTLGRKFVDFGADLVVGTHSHRLQEVEYYNDVPIVYGIGNFIFGSTWTDTEVLSVTFDYADGAEWLTKIKLIPGTCGYELTSPLSTEQKQYKFVEENIIPKSPTCVLDDDGFIIKNNTIIE